MKAHEAEAIVTLIRHTMDGGGTFGTSYAEINSAFYKAVVDTPPNTLLNGLPPISQARAKLLEIATRHCPDSGEMFTALSNEVSDAMNELQKQARAEPVRILGVVLTSINLSLGLDDRSLKRMIEDALK